MKFLYLSFLCLFSLTGISQTKLSFSFDAAGNQVLRTTGSSYRKTKVEPLVQDSTESFTAFPIPVTGNLTVKWVSDEANPLQILQIHTVEGQLLFQRKIESKRGQINLDFSGYIRGMYILTGINADGKTHVVKIIHQ